MRVRAGVTAVVAVLCAAGAVAATGASAGASAAPDGSGALTPGNLLVSESVYTKAPNIVADQTQLPPGCTGSNCVAAVADGDYPEVFNNAPVDGSFGVADEGNGTNTYANGSYTATAAQTTAGQKWVFNSTAGKWRLAYTLQAGLNLGQPYTVPGYPTGINAATGLPWSPASDGLRNITGRVNSDGTVTIWAITSTVSGGGDQGADPNKLVEITDPLSATAPAAGETFSTIRTAAFAEVLRGVSFTPGTR